MNALRAVEIVRMPNGRKTVHFKHCGRLTVSTVRALCLESDRHRLLSGGEPLYTATRRDGPASVPKLLQRLKWRMASESHAMTIWKLEPC